MQGDKFKGRYTVDDGYVGGSRPHHFSFYADDLDDVMTDVDLVNAYDQAVQDHFKQRITPEASDVEAFIVWAREQLAKRGA